MKAEIIYEGETVTVEWEEPTIVIESSGTQGPKGDKGDTGEQGIQGEPGEQGQRGEKGDKGDKGDTGPQGEKGDKGDKGDTGEKGDTGATGATGPQGEPGPKGDTGATGPKGDTGAQGEQGNPGQDGVSPTITVTDITGGHRVTITDADGPHSFDVMDGEDGAGAVQDVQVNGTSVLDAQGVANVPVAADRGATGVVKINRSFGITETAGILTFQPTTVNDTKGGASALRAVLPSIQHAATFYGLAKAAGDSTQSASSNTVGNYTDAAKSAISQMLNGSVSVSGTTPTINALPGIRYVCGEVTTLDIALPASGIVDVVFESGSTPTTLTVTPPTGMTMKWANGFDPASLEANTTYEINIADGLGVAASWT